MRQSTKVYNNERGTDTSKAPRSLRQANEFSCLFIVGPYTLRR
jgi:hypothetical protein